AAGPHSRSSVAPKCVGRRCAPPRQSRVRSWYVSFPALHSLVTCAHVPHLLLASVFTASSVGTRRAREEHRHDVLDKKALLHVDTRNGWQGSTGAPLFGGGTSFARSRPRVRGGPAPSWSGRDAPGGPRRHPSGPPRCTREQVSVTV